MAVHTLKCTDSVLLHYRTAKRRPISEEQHASKTHDLAFTPDLWDWVEMSILTLKYRVYYYIIISEY